jgi:diphthamide synthase subunit DPH2
MTGKEIAVVLVGLVVGVSAVVGFAAAMSWDEDDADAFVEGGTEAVVPPAVSAPLPPAVAAVPVEAAVEVMTPERAAEVAAEEAGRQRRLAEAQARADESFRRMIGSLGTQAPAGAGAPAPR